MSLPAIAMPSETEAPANPPEIDTAAPSAAESIVASADDWTSTWRPAMTWSPAAPSMANSRAVVVVSISLIENAAPTATATPT